MATKEENRVHYKEKRHWYLHRDAKKRAKEMGREFSISLEDIVIPSKCKVFGTPFDIVGFKNGVKNRDFSPSIDRIDNSKGYIKGNIQVISLLANKMKSSATVDQLIKFAEWVLKTYTKPKHRACTN